MRLAKNALKWFTSKAIIMLIGFLSSIVFARVLGAKVLGAFYLFMSLVSILGRVGNLGIGATIVQKLSSKEPKRYFSASVILILITSLILSLSIFLFKKKVNLYVGGYNVWYLLVLVLFFRFLTTLGYNALKAKKLVGRAGFIKSFERITTVFFQLILIYLGFELFGMITGLIVSLLIISVSMGFIVDLKLKKPSRRHLKEVVRFTSFSWIDGFVGAGQRWIDLFLIGSLSTGSSAAGVYGITWAISENVNFSGAIGQSILPEISDYHYKNKKKKIARVVKDSLAYLPIIILPVFFGSLILSKDILGTIYGPKFENGWLVLIILLLSMVFITLSVSPSQFFYGVSKPEKVFKVDAIATLLNILIGAPLLYYYGIIGVAVGTLASSLIMCFFLMYILKKELGSVFPIKKWIKEVISSSMMLVFVFVLTKFLNTSNIYYLLTTVLLGGMIYFTILLYIDRDIYKLAKKIFIGLIEK
ncbi:MAG: MATE family membrane protein Rfbx family AglR [Candidatus Methanohalarchaeum thermophilum]|uniref:MATE family membrane protein Rfbx family AglR n=1 Tax=Methanohalarchaeum thermophilum TaxID=1903181 RepID=A0A1Q6DSU3_METT1|nr:MAG: MATE family membrane protein Rfbx family AglR [Candidatus Methanohalarchaeum thermophilum]